MSSPSVSQVIEGRYRLEQVIGRGGMGAVYRARDLRLDRSVAVKIVPAELFADDEAAHRFRREAQIAARLEHPAIVTIFDYGTLPTGGAFLVMELVHGEDLRRALLRDGRMEPELGAAILTSVCAGVEAAHRQGVLHRDLKPENILLPSQSDVAAKVLDFGIALAFEQHGDPAGTRQDAASMRTGEDHIVGTPAYMAPEQLHGAPLDARADVFSLGVIAYEMLSGELPFGRGSFGEVALAHTRGVRPLRPGAIPPGIERAVRAALDPDVDRRPPSPQAFAHLIGAALRM